MARQKSAETELEDMTECSICTEAFTDPRVLPCIHTFCLNCLLNYDKDRQPGDTMHCPLCRNEFAIPDDGLAGIQKNFFMEKLLHVRRLSAGEATAAIPCDICSLREASSAPPKTAVMHCVQCQQNYCEECSWGHANMKVSSDHVQVEIGKQVEKKEIMLKLPAATCDVHNKDIEVFCNECKLAICMMCFITSHKNHDCADIKVASAEFRSQLEIETEKVTEDWKTTGELVCSFEEKTQDYTKRLADVENEINESADKLIDSIQRDRKKLLSEVESIRKKRFKELEMVKQELEQHMAALESFKRYSETLLSSGTHCDVVRSAKSLHDRAEELVKFDVAAHVNKALPEVCIEFVASDFSQLQLGKNLLGKIHEDMKPRTPTVKHVLPQHNTVSAVASLETEVYVLCTGNKEVAVYDANSFSLQRHLAVPGFGSSHFCSMTVCATNRCLYVPDHSNNCIHRVELSGNNAVMKWSVAACPKGVSVNSAQNVIVVSENEHKLQEFTTRGSLVRNIQLHADVQDSQQAMQLEKDQFLVSHEGSLHRVCLVSGDGKVVRSYGGSAGSDLTKMKRPRGLAVDKHGNVLVADWNNHRLLVLDQSLSSAHEMPVSVDRGLKGPYCLHYDESRCRLYVGEFEGKRVIVIHNMDDFTASKVEPMA